jgi:ADP-heptose:LPS heptosyltransferase
MFRRDILSWWLRPAFLRAWGRRRDVLFAGPWVGEFGWELMHWQGFLRKLSRAYRKTVVCCPAGHEALYADFATETLAHDLRGTAECNVLRDIQNPEERERIRRLIPEDCDHLEPLGYQPFSRQEFVRFGKPHSGLEVDVLFHPRGRVFGADRNWSADRWHRLIALLRGRGLRLGCLGLRAATLPLEGDFLDLRDKPLSETLDIIASARAVLGPSSGPMHLASLCGPPHVVWTAGG